MAGMAGMEQMLRPMLRTSGASMFGLQLGQGLGQLAAEVVGATDIGLPLSEPGHVALLPTNVEGLRGRSGAVRQRRHPLSGPARVRPAAAVRRGRLVARADAGPGRAVRERHHHRHLGAGAGGRPGRPQQPGRAELHPGGRPVRAAEDPGAGGRAAAAGDDAGPGRGLGRRGGHPGDRAADAGRRRRWPRPYAGPGRPEGRPRPRSPPWSAWSCGPAGCGTPPTCGRRCGMPGASRAATQCGPTRTWCPPRPTWTTRWASSPPSRTRGRRRRLRRRAGRAVGRGGPRGRRPPPTP